MRTAVINESISSREPRSVVAANAIAPIPSTIAAKLTRRPTRASDSPGGDWSTARNSSIEVISAISSADIELMSWPGVVPADAAPAVAVADREREAAFDRMGVAGADAPAHTDLAAVERWVEREPEDGAVLGRDR